MSVVSAPRSGSASRNAGDLAIAGLRIMLGVLFLTVWGSNLNKGLYGPESYANLINSFADSGDSPGVWKSIMSFVADQAAVTSKLQLVTELTFGVLLLLGIATRLVGVAAGVFLSSIWLSSIGVPNEWIWSLVFPALAAFTVAIFSAGRTLGLDSVLLARSPLRRLPRWATG